MNSSMPSTPGGGTALTSAMTSSFFASLLVLLGNDLHAGGGGGEDHLGVGDDFALLLRRLAVDGFEVDTEALLGDLGVLDDAFDAAMRDELYVGAFECGDDGGGEADDAGGAEYGDLHAFPVAVELILQHALDAGDHGGGSRERAGGVREDRALERRHHRLGRGFHHVEGNESHPCRP